MWDHTSFLVSYAIQTTVLTYKGDKVEIIVKYLETTFASFQGVRTTGCWFVDG
jgi:hypothetical protein